MKKKIFVVSLRIDEDIFIQHNKLIEEIKKRSGDHTSSSDAFRAVMNAVLKNPERKEAVTIDAVEFLNNQNE